MITKHIAHPSLHPCIYPALDGIPQNFTRPLICHVFCNFVSQPVSQVVSEPCFHKTMPHVTGKALFCQTAQQILIPLKPLHEKARKPLTSAFWHRQFSQVEYSFH